MIQDKTQLVRDGLETAYIDGNIASEISYKPGFISNNHREGKKVISVIESELLKCDKFQISVAFITLGGVTPLLQTLKELERKGVPGEILTSNYLDFSEPLALEKLHSLKNIKIRMYDTRSANNGFHTKGYIFREEEIYRIIIGSSNITSAALTTNREWNTKLVSTAQGEMSEDILREFDELWNSEYALDYDVFYEEYKQRYDIIKAQRKIASEGNVTSLERYKLKPNSMQVRFIANLKAILENDEKRALLISATGTGKTYASAFAMRELGFKRVLFLVHRASLAVQAKKSYQRVFGSTISVGLVGAGYHEYDRDYIFATVETLNRDEHLQMYDPAEFDCIILDEAHHSSANTYQKVTHREFKDLSIIYKVVLKMTDEGWYSTAVTNKYAEHEGITEPDLFKCAAKNTKELFPPVIKSMADVIREIFSKDGMPTEIAEAMVGEISENQMMYVITNDVGINGAVSMLYEDGLHNLAEHIGSDLYILPSSIHEVIAVSADMGNPTELADMVSEVNMSAVAIGDRLSNQVYHYDKDLRKVTLATDTPNKRLDGIVSEAPLVFDSSKSR